MGNGASTNFNEILTIIKKEIVKDLFFSFFLYFYIFITSITFQMKRILIIFIILLCNHFSFAQDYKANLKLYVEEILDYSTNLAEENIELSNQIPLANREAFNTAFLEMQERYIDAIAGAYNEYYETNTTLINDAVELYKATGKKTVLGNLPQQNQIALNKIEQIFKIEKLELVETYD